MSGPVSIAFALRRGALYRLCSIALAYPVPGRLAEVARVGTVVLPSVEPPLHPHVAALVEAAREERDGAVASEYVRLFDRAAACPPYEGAYGPPQMAGKAALLADVAGFYTAFGLEPADGQPDVEDHIATELEFLSVLAVKEAWALAEDHRERAEIARDATLAFLGDHLARWAPAFADALDAASTLGYYRAVAGMLRAWVAADTARLGVTILPLAPAAPDAAMSEPFTCPMAGAPD